MTKNTIRDRLSNDDDIDRLRELLHHGYIFLIYDPLNTRTWKRDAPRVLWPISMN